MKKSPFSMSRGGNGGHRSMRDSRSDFNASDCIGHSSVEASPQKLDGDFIPLEMSSPANDSSRNSGIWQRRTGGGRARRDPMENKRYGYSRNSFVPSPRSDSSSPYYTSYQYATKQRFDRSRGNFNKGSHRTVDISRYVNLSAFLEDPWKDLEERLHGTERYQASRESNSPNCSDDSDGSVHT